MKMVEKLVWVMLRDGSRRGLNGRYIGLARSAQHYGPARVESGPFVAASTHRGVVGAGAFCVTRTVLGAPRVSDAIALALRYHTRVISALGSPTPFWFIQLLGGPRWGNDEGDPDRGVADALVGGVSTRSARPGCVLAVAGRRALDRAS